MKKAAYYIAALAAVMVIGLGITGCGKKEGTETKTVDIEKIHTAVKEAYGEDYIPNMPYDSQMFTDVFGVTEDMYDSYIAEGPMISTNVDTFIAVDAKEGKGEAVEEALNKYRTYLQEESMQYPMNMPKVQAASVVRHGDYVFFVMLGIIPMDTLDEGDEASLKKAEENNQIGLDVIDSYFQE